MALAAASRSFWLLMVLKQFWQRHSPWQKICLAKQSQYIFRQLEFLQLHLVPPPPSSLSLPLEDEPRLRRLPPATILPAAVIVEEDPFFGDPPRLGDFGDGRLVLLDGDNNGPVADIAAAADTEPPPPPPPPPPNAPLALFLVPALRLRGLLGASLPLTPIDDDRGSGLRVDDGFFFFFFFFFLVLLLLLLLLSLLPPPPFRCTFFFLRCCCCCCCWRCFWAFIAEASPSMCSRGDNTPPKENACCPRRPPAAAAAATPSLPSALPPSLLWLCGESAGVRGENFCMSRR